MNTPFSSLIPVDHAADILSSKTYITKLYTNIIYIYREIRMIFSMILQCAYSHSFIPWRFCLTMFHVFEIVALLLKLIKEEFQLVTVLKEKLWKRSFVNYSIKMKETGTSIEFLLLEFESELKMYIDASMEKDTHCRCTALFVFSSSMT